MNRTTAPRSIAPLVLAVALLSGCALVGGISDETTAPPTTPPPVGTTTAAAAAAAAAANDDRRQVILDYSPTVSDVGALVFLASRPELRLIAVTVAGTGESYCEPGVAHTRGLLEELGLPDVPVACGPDNPVTGWNAFPTSWRVASSEMDLPTAPPNETRSAPTLLADLIGAADNPIEIVAVGPLTNLAAALDMNPGLTTNIAGITIMGGAIDVPGNVMRNDVGEWNIWVDPTAAGSVVASGVPITLVPLDATNDLPTGRIFWQALDAVAGTTAARIVRDVWAANEVWIDNPGGFYFWDELAAAILIDDSLAEFENRRIVVDDTTRENKGWTRQDPDGTEIRVAVGAHRREFEQLFLDTLVGAPAELGYVEPTTAEIAYFEALASIEAETSAALDAIFVATATEMGLDEQDDDDTFFEVVAAAVPSVLRGPWADRLEAIRSLDVPPTLAVVHDSYALALEAFAAAEPEVTRVLESNDLKAFETLFGPLTESCAAIEAAAAIRTIEVDLRCS